MSTYGKYIVSYDITSRRERSQVSRILTGYGFRVQKSVFECLLSPAARARLIDELERLKLETGFIYIYRVSKAGKRIGLGKVPPSPDNDFAFVV